MIKKIFYANLRVLVVVALFATYATASFDASAQSRTFTFGQEKPKPKPKPKPGTSTKPKTPSQPKITFDKANMCLKYNGNIYELRILEGNKFLMGATQEQNDYALQNEYPVHPVILDTYAMGYYEVPVWLYRAVMGGETEYFEDEDLPVRFVSWKDCNDFVTKLNSLTKESFDLPTEAQWEYASRGGIFNKNFVYSGTDSSVEAFDNAPNDLGIFGMSASVREWCKDWYAPYYEASQICPTGPESGIMKVVRGGSYLTNSNEMRNTYRGYLTPETESEDLGFRIIYKMVK